MILLDVAVLVMLLDEVDLDVMLLDVAVLEKLLLLAEADLIEELLLVEVDLAEMLLADRDLVLATVGREFTWNLKQNNSNPFRKVIRCIYLSLSRCFYVNYQLDRYGSSLQCSF